MARSDEAIRRLAGFSTALTLEDLPDRIAEQARLKILDSWACAFLAADSDFSRIGRSLAARVGDGPCTTILDRRSLPIGDAAFVNSAAIHAILQDDVDLTIGHPACCVIPAAFAAGEAGDASGADLVCAIVMGYETMWRVGGRGTWMIPAISKGFRGNTILGAFGSAAAGARVLNLDTDQTASAIGAAASFAAGLLEPLNAGTMERPFQQAANARAGLYAALLASEGLHGSTSVLEGKGGFYDAFIGEDSFPEDAADDLGSDYYLTESFAKPYPSAGSNTVGIAVLDHLLAVNDIQGTSITDMVVEVVPRFTGRPGYPAIASTGPFKTLENALISFPFNLACLAKFGGVTLDSLTAALLSSDVTALARRIELRGVDVPYPLWCRIEVKDGAGKSYVATADDIEWRHFYLDSPTATGKFLAAADGVLSAETAERVVAAVLDLGGHTAVRDLGALLRG